MYTGHMYQTVILIKLPIPADSAATVQATKFVMVDKFAPVRKNEP